MTENEAKTNLELVTNKWESAEEMFSDSMDIIIDQEFVNTLYIAIKALVELPQYRAIGTVEELKATSKYLHLAKKHGTVGKAIEACTEYEGIGTVEECREAMKKKSEKPMAELGVFGNPEEKDIGRLEALHHKILYSKLAESVTEQEMIALLRAKDALKKQLSECPVDKTKPDSGYGNYYKNARVIVCPNCNGRLKLKSKGKYCDKCGQKLSWENHDVKK